MPRKTNVPTAALRWSVERAGIEFGLTSNTLRKALAKNSAAADADGLFSTAQILAALYGALHVERLRTQRARAEQLELENAITRGNFLNRAELMKGLAAIADAFVSRLNAATEVPRQVREDLQRDLATWPSALQGAAHRQTRLLLRGSNNGHDHDENGSESESSDYEGAVPAAKNRRRSAAREKRR
jgi:hypothetical protein